MEAQDTLAPFRQRPWTAKLVDHPDLVSVVPTSRAPKSTTEDSLYAEILKTDRTIRSCVAIYRKPASQDDAIEEATTLYEVGDGMNGHPEIIHGGIIATMLDESMGILQNINLGNGLAGAEKASQADNARLEQGLGAFTAFLNVKYLKPVRTPGAIAVVARRTKKEGRKEWLYAEVKQCHGSNPDELMVCATGESLFVTPKPSLESKL